MTVIKRIIYFECVPERPRIEVLYEMMKSLNLGQSPSDGQYNPKIVSAIKMI